MLFTVAPPVCVAINSTTKIVRHYTARAHLPFTENSRSTYVSFENEENPTNKDVLELKLQVFETKLLPNNILFV